MRVTHRLRAVAASAILLLGAAPAAVPQPAHAAAARPMENLNRGVVAVRASDTDVLITWRLLGLDPDGIGFNVYRSTAGGAGVKLNTDLLTGGTNFVDSTADLTRRNSYYVRPIIDGVWQPASESFLLTADHAVEPVVRVPLRAGGPIRYVWVGDLDGDGGYDYVLGRQTAPQTVEAYRGDGTFLWSVDMGPNSLDQSTIESGSSTINLGHADGMTVYDFDGDGRAEVALQIANGVVFGNGVTYTALPSDTHQAITILDGRTGVPRATAPVPTDYLSDGSMGTRFGVGYLDGLTPSLVAYMKNRQDNKDFNLMYTAWRFTGSALTRQWKFLRGDQNLPDGHNTRIIDLDQDGDDEIAEIGFALNGDGTLRYSLSDEGVVHGDRWHIADMDPSRPGLEGYGVQQDNPSGLREYYYGAKNGNMLWQHVEDGVADVGRGMAGDIDPRYVGMEVWSFSGVYNARSDTLTQATGPWPHLGVFWDGDLSMELFNDGRIEKWDPATGGVARQVTTWHHGAVNIGTQYPAMIGDIFGDWREEVVMTNAAYDELVIFTTDKPTITRLYTLAHNPAYRNDMTVKGYLQDHHVDYYLGTGMATPPRPNISYVGS
ncbi:hypothetical protein FAF44_00345 [Nonomuraea sp. MG754425]|uniref:rhamnogalacturonan lyase family protein n=1 Tax=Nonomuraea sp. MG754425 TaxID=2570319 RepID=UPI001F43E83F|nr:FG-GAP-like repeat-containing protein [Nonomuraea sp. MG754425]MCF6466865.1 hypothetical protein [Nonomuraea sp. MG754425]